MTQSTSTYIYLLTCFFCFVVSAKDKEYIDPSKILLVFYNCNKDIATNETSIKCVIEDTDCIQCAYNQIKKNKNETTVFIHGYKGSRNIVPVPEIVSAYYSRNISVIATLDWSPLAKGDKFVVSNRVPKIGQIIASSLNFLNDKGYKIAKWHLIGHSMGAHIAACIGTYSDFTFSHITGLDPAAHFFYSDMYNDCRFNPKVADFTDVFYTDCGGHGTFQVVGDLNIYTNTGTAPQLGCCSSRDIHLCSHMRAAEWYADAVRNETMYLATECADCFSFLRYAYCLENDQIYLGPHIDTKKTGSYCIPIV